jgi:hypothetical protein
VMIDTALSPRLQPPFNAVETWIFDLDNCL